MTPSLTTPTPKIIYLASCQVCQNVSYLVITIATLGLRKADRFLLLPKSAGASEEEASEEGEDEAEDSEESELPDEDSEDAPESPVDTSVEPKN